MSEAFDRTRRVVIGESGLGPYGQVAVARRHVFTADEPQGLGGRDTGPDPIEILMASLAACSSMTMRMYAQQKKWEIGKITIAVEHDWISSAGGEKQDRFRRVVTIEPMPEDKVMVKLLEIADRCLVHRALTGSPIIETIAEA